MQSPSEEGDAGTMRNLLENTRRQTVDTTTTGGVMLNASPLIMTFGVRAANRPIFGQQNGTQKADADRCISDDLCIRH